MTCAQGAGRCCDLCPGGEGGRCCDLVLGGGVGPVPRGCRCDLCPPRGEGGVVTCAGGEGGVVTCAQGGGRYCDLCPGGRKVL